MMQGMMERLRVALGAFLATAEGLPQPLIVDF